MRRNWQRLIMRRDVEKEGESDDEPEYLMCVCVCVYFVSMTLFSEQQQSVVPDPRQHNVVA